MNFAGIAFTIAGAIVITVFFCACAFGVAWNNGGDRFVESVLRFLRERRTEKSNKDIELKRIELAIIEAKNRSIDAEFLRWDQRPQV